MEGWRHHDRRFSGNALISECGTVYPDILAGRPVLYRLHMENTLPRGLPAFARAFPEWAARPQPAMRSLQALFCPCRAGVAADCSHVFERNGIMMKKPHLIFFNPDQFRADALGHLGNPAAAAPNLDRRAVTDGVSFRN